MTDPLTQPGMVGQVAEELRHFMFERTPCIDVCSMRPCACAHEFTEFVIKTMRNRSLVYRDDGHVVHEMRGAPDDIWKTFLDAALSEQRGA